MAHIAIKEELSNQVSIDLTKKKTDTYWYPKLKVDLECVYVQKKAYSEKQVRTANLHKNRTKSKRILPIQQGF